MRKIKLDCILFCGVCLLFYILDGTEYTIFQDGLEYFFLFFLYLLIGGFKNIKQNQEIQADLQQNEVIVVSIVTVILVIFYAYYYSIHGNLGILDSNGKLTFNFIYLFFVIAIWISVFYSKKVRKRHLK